MSTMYDHALTAAAAGICVLPPRQDGSKAPDISSWKVYQHRRPTERELKYWFDDPSRTGIGYLCGEVSQGLELLDFDDGGSAWDDFQALVEDNGLGELWARITSGYLERTPHGGYHVLFRSPHPTGAITLAQRPKRPEEKKHERDNWQVLIETKGEGGYVVAAPSNGAVHPSGGRYELLRGDLNTIAVITTDEREALLAVARMLNQKPRPMYGAGSGPRTDAAHGDKPGDWYNVQTSWEELLPAYGWRVHFRSGEMTYWTRPGKDRGVSATTNYKGNNLLWTFTTSTDLDPDRSYDRFGFYAVMEHGGDFQAAARELRRQGYRRPAATHEPRGNGLREGVAAGEDAQESADDVPPQLRASDFVSHLEANKYLCRPTGKLWERASVNKAVAPIKIGTDTKGDPVFQLASSWIDEHEPVHQVTWSPGDPEIIEGRLLNQGGWIERPDFRAYNLYQPPTISSGDPEQAGRWVEHVRLLYPDQADHIIKWSAHRVQHPEEKINHALLLGGGQGIGKDTMLKPVREAIGPWNYADASPTQVMGRFNGFLKSVILLVPELCDLGDINRYAFYEHMKPIIAAPPETLRCDEKFVQETQVLNVTGVIFTSNQRIGIYLPAGDRRHFAAWSELDPTELPDGYFNALHHWLDREQGTQHVAAYLHAFDLTGFDPNAPPPKTEWFWSIVDAGRAPEESELATLLDSMSLCPGEEEWPDAITLAQLVKAEKQRSGEWNSDERDKNGLASWLEDRKNRRQIPHRLEAVGYVPVRNDGAKDGFWSVGGVRMVVYAKRELERRDQIAAVNQLISGAGK